MENKYQFSLNKIINHKCYEKESSCWDYVKTIYKEETDTLQELVDKENPMKVDMKDNKKIKCDKFLITLVTYYKCPNKNCEFHNNYNILEEKKRCDECGQLLDWSDIDE